ncbi:MAG TPA: TonB-dependent receptor plug domain-containing protein [Panacibacter sp.]|nr:TonB-dependent receptor plug domain-containing protein [Panacibacter sp.]HNP46451.1 TonB-dependent receptor plug domain-containing protein [Panacibacter sp.]
MRIPVLALFLFLCPLCIKAQHDSLPGVSQLVNLSLEELMNIKVVSASGYLQTPSEAPSTITVITARQISERGYEQLEDALRDIPGIDMIHINGYAPTLIYFRGMYGAENLRALLMIDGIAENNILGSNDMAGPAYSLHSVERIEIIWGPVSALYGANAFGGIINIISKKGGNIDGLHFETGFGSFNTIFQKLHLGARKGKFEFAASGTLYSTDGPKFTNRDPNYTASYVDKAFSFNGAVSYYAAKSKTTLGYRVYQTPMGWGTYSNSPTVYLGLPSQGNGNLGILGVLQRDIRGEKSGLDNSYLRTWYIQNEYKPGDKLNILGRVVYRETGTADDSYIYATLAGTRLIRVPIASYSNRLFGELSARYAPSEKHTISAGVDYYQDNVESGARQSTLDLTTIYLLDGKDTLLNLYSTFLPRKYDLRENFGSHLQYVYSSALLGKTNFTLGLRYDHNSYFGDAASPRIAIVNQPAPKLTFKFQFGNAFRAPTNLEIHQVIPDSSFHIKKEKIRTYEINAIYAASKNLQLQVNGFRNELSDVIILGNLTGLIPDKNAGVFKITGAEFSMNMVVAKNIAAFLNFTYQHTWGKNLATGNSGQLPGMATVKGNAGITVHLEDLFILSVSGNWVGPRRSPRTDPYGPVAGYFLTNASLSTKELFKAGVTASFRVQNMFNTQWLDPGFRTADGFLYSTVLEQPGITGLFKIAINL